MRKVVAIQFDSIRFNVTVVNVTVENGRELATGVALMVCLSVCLSHILKSILHVMREKSLGKHWLRVWMSMRVETAAAAAAVGNRA